MLVGVILTNCYNLLTSQTAAPHSYKHIEGVTAVGGMALRLKIDTEGKGGKDERRVNASDEEGWRADRYGK